jgi:hypothetical protein
MKPVYQMYAYFCSSCGRYAWEARIPEGKQPKDAGPGQGTLRPCGGHTFEARKAA